ncbi:hypothetical protein COHA_008005 [Chlorella ohadii]|uniref:DNA-directed DNA polymerase n=1 Tax=Chlorella ohadii TaxID=2649997 RepID=A0AAD5DHJ1_9CHLO|nr:hypothetical protein COHA_008005 [Chlorella ohadii]
MGLEVERAYGGHYSETWLQRNTGVIVATPERAQMLLNRKLAAGVDPTHLFRHALRPPALLAFITISGVVVFDEIHEVAGGRGHTYRSLLSKLRYMQATAQCKLQQQAAASPADGSNASGSPAGSHPSSQAAVTCQPMRIVCMSATRTGQSATARLLGARLYVKTTEREVQLRCHLVLLNGLVVDQQEQVARERRPVAGHTVLERVAALCEEAAAASQQALVFCGTKKGCEVSAKHLARALDNVPELPRQGEHAPSPAGPDAATATPALGTATPTRAGFSEQLRQLGSQGDSRAAALGGLVEHGVAFHHAGLSRPVQQLVLEAFRTGAISLLCCTTTLAQSVNLPAERVIFRDAWVRQQGMHLDPDSYHQMAGRAGRPGLATLGEVFLLAGKEQPPEAYLRGLLRSKPGDERPAPVLHKCSEEVLAGHLLEAIAGCGARTAEDVTHFLKCTYAGAANMQPQAERLPDEVAQRARAALKWLGRPSWPRKPAGQAAEAGDRDLAMIEYDREDRCFRPLPLGRAVLASSLQLEEALSIRPCFLSVSPYHLPDMTDRQWRKLGDEWTHAPAASTGRARCLFGLPCHAEKEALLRLAGSCEDADFAERFQHFVAARQLEAGPEDGQGRHMRAPRPEEQRCQRLCQRILAALALRALLQEGATEEAVRQEFGYGELGRAFADMREHCGVFAGKAAAFAALVGQSRGAEGWTYLAAVLKKFQQHLRSGSKLELLSLRELEDLDEATARLLYNAGLMDLQAVADAEEESVYRALLNRPQGKSTSQEAEQRARRQAREIQQAAREAVGDPTRALRSRGKQVLKRRRLNGRQQLRQQHPRLGAGTASGHRSSEEAAEEEEGEEEAEEDGEEPTGRTAASAEGQEEDEQPFQQDEEMEDAGAREHQAGAGAGAGAAGQPADGREAGGHRRKREGSGAPGDSRPAAKQARWEPLPLPVPWRQQPQQQPQQPLQQPQPQPQPQQQEEQQQQPEQAEQLEQQQQQQPEAILGPQQLPPHAGMSDPGQSSSDDGGSGSNSRDSSSSPAGSDSEAGGGKEDSDGGDISSARAGVSAVIISTPAPGTCDLRLCASLDDIRQLCAALRSKQLSCLGFALHLAAGSSASMMLPPPPPRCGAAAAQHEKQQQQQQQQRPTGSPAAGSLLGVAISWRNGAAAYIPLHRSDGSLDAAAAEEVGALLDASRSGSLGTTCFRASLDLQSQVAALQSLLHPGAERWRRLPAQLVDIRLAAWLLHPSSSALYSGPSGGRISGRPGKGGQDSRLESLLDRVLGKVAGPGNAAAARAAWASLTPAAAAAAVAAAGVQAQHANAPPDGWLQACQVAAASRVGWELLLPQLRGVPRLMDALLEQEQPLAVVLAAMERAGMGCSTATWERLARRIEARLRQIVEDVHLLPDVQRLRRTISLTSHSQVPKLLFSDLQLRPPPCAKKLRRGWFSTDKEAIGRMMALGQTHPVLPLILEYRKASSTLKFLNKLLESARACNAAGTAGAAGAADEASGPGAGPRVRQPLLQTNSDTGRLAMDDPSLQCVPNAHELLLRTRDPSTGREVPPVGPAAEACPRKGFVAAPGCLLLSADYKQAELRLMAHFSGDEELRRMCEDGQQDVFELLAARWLKHGDSSQVTRAERDRAKAVTYALIYGLGNGRLGEDLNMTAKEAAAEKERFLASLPKLRAFLDQVVQDCRSTGYVEMLSGRRRWLPGINSPQWQMWGKAERAAVNTVVQGSAADVAKRAMLALHARLPSEDAQLVNMVHDELLVEVRADRLQRVAALVLDAMEGAAPELTVPLRVQLRAGPSWGELQPLELQVLPESEDAVGASLAGGLTPAEVAAAATQQQQRQQQGG